MGRLQLASLALTVLLGVAVAWSIRAGHWRRGRLALVVVALLAAFAFVTRRVGWGELLILAVLVLVPAMILPGPSR